MKPPLCGYNACCWVEDPSIRISIPPNKTSTPPQLAGRLSTPQVFDETTPGCKIVAQFPLRGQGKADKRIKWWNRPMYFHPTPNLCRKYGLRLRPLSQPPPFQGVEVMLTPKHLNLNFLTGGCTWVWESSLELPPALLTGRVLRHRSIHQVLRCPAPEKSPASGPASGAPARSPRSPASEAPSGPT